MNKKEVIKSIRDIIKKYGDFTVADVYAETSPLFFQNFGISVFMEEFNENDVILASYTPKDSEPFHTQSFSWDSVLLFSDSLIDEIYVLAQKWESENS